MLVVFLSCFTFLQSFLKPYSFLLQFLASLFSKSLHTLFLFFNKRRKFSIRRFRVPPSKTISSPATDSRKNGSFLLDLPDLPLDCVLEKLPPVDLWTLSKVCSCLRERCTSDGLWEKHMRRRWGGVIGDGAYTEWQSQVSSKMATKHLHCKTQRGLRGFLPVFDIFGSKTERITRRLPTDSVMSWYLALETGTFWFPAQVFNREKGHLGFVLSCYDARLCYDSTTNNFVARYSQMYRANGRSIIEDGIRWDQIRAPTTDAPTHVAHASECLHELKPGCHIEIQWRKSKEFPYGWWYGVVGHVDSCLLNQFHCQCHINDKVVLEFKQYCPGSRWRKMVINRMDHRETGNETDGFYGGIRKLHKEDEIAKWRELRPKCTLQ